MVPDTARRYGTVSRTLHWGMALLFAWMFFTAIVHAVAEKSALDKQLFVTHKQVGSLLMVLVLVRAAWALAHRRQRPPELNAAALVGHVAIYTLMFAVPAVSDGEVSTVKIDGSGWSKPMAPTGEKDRRSYL